MDHSLAFRRSLSARFAGLLGLAALTPIAVAACGDGSSTTGSGGGGASLEQDCFTPTDSGMVTLADCPPSTSAAADLPASCGAMPVHVVSGPVLVKNQCCYQVQSPNCGTGRPFLVGAVLITAALAQASGFCALDEARPRVDDLTADERAALAEAWSRDGLLEHASIASFGRFALELMAVGAPAHLIEAAHAAAVDEVRHAKLCFGLASAYLGAPVGPSAFPFGGRVELGASLRELAVSTVREGCIGETLAAVLAAEQLARANDPAVRAVLAVIAEDEACHAELAWRTVAWAIAEGGDEVRAAALAELEKAHEALPAAGSATSEAFEEHGRLAPNEARAAARRAIDELVLPSARAFARRVERADEARA